MIFIQVLPTLAVNKVKWKQNFISMDILLFVDYDMDYELNSN